MSDDKFTPVSKADIEPYKVLGRHRTVTFMVDQDEKMGCVFSISPYTTDRNEYLWNDNGFAEPIMLVNLIEGIKGFKRAHFPRIRQAHSKACITIGWYESYAKNRGGIVSDDENQPGGKALWQSLIKRASMIKQGSVTVCNLQNPEIERPVRPQDIPWLWPADGFKSDLVLIYRA